MGFAQGLVLALLGMLFAAWGMLAFRILLRLAARAREASDGVPGPSTQLAVWNGWLRDPADRRARRGFLAVSVALFAAIALAVWVMAPAAG